MLHLGKRVLGLALCLMTAVGMLLVMMGKAKADETQEYETEDGFMCEEYEEYINILSYNGAGGDIVIPDKISGKPVTGIKNNAFSNSSVKSVVISGSMKFIGESAFESCLSLESVTFKDKVGVIESAVFNNCTSLKQVSFHKDVEVIGSYVFYGCLNLENIVFSGNIGVLGKDFLDPSIKTSIVFGGEVGEIQSGALHTVNVDTIIFQKKVNKIKDGAFLCEGQIKEITFEGDVGYIEAEAFSGCDGINNFVLTFKGNVENMEAFAFCQLQGLTIVFEKDVETIPELAFSDNTGNGDLEVVFKGEVKSIEKEAFYECESLKTITFEGKVGKIGENAFHGCKKLFEVDFKDDVTTIGEGAFSECESLGPVNFDGNVGTIGDGAFNKSGSDRFDINFGQSVQTIGNNAFAECKGLRDIRFSGVKLVGAGAFAKCPDIINVELYSSPEDYLKIDDLCFLKCPKLEKVLIGGNGSVTFGVGAFNGCTSLSEFQYGGGGSICFASEVFSGCTKLTVLELFGSGFDFANDVFKDSGITEVYISDFDYLSFEYHTFEYATNLNCAFFSGKHIIIGEEAFAGSTIEVLNITGDVEDIGNSAFSGCSKLRDISINGNVRIILKEAFSGCIGIESIIFKGDVNKIEEKAFAGCSGLKSVVFSGDVKTIGSKAFENSTSLKTVFIPKSATVASDAFPSNTNVVYYELQESSSYYCVTGVTPVVKVTLNGTTLVPGEDYQVTYMKKSQSVGNIVNEGTYTVSVKLSDQYDGLSANLNFKVLALPLSADTVYAEYSGGKKTYNGSDLVSEIYNAVTVKLKDSDEVLPKDDYRIDFSTDGNSWSSKCIGAGEYFIRICSSGDNTKSKFITSIKVSVEKLAAEFTADSDSKTYDGTPLTKNSFTHSKLAEGDSVDKVIIESSRVINGMSDNVIASIKIVNENGDDVTDNYDITRVNGILEVKQAKLTITAGSEEKIYDGKALTMGITSAGLADGDKVEKVTVSGSQTEVGSCDNVPSAAKITNAAGDDVTGCYDITYISGLLTVNRVPAPALKDEWKPVPKTGLKENGEEQELVTAPALIPDYTVMYSTDFGKTWSSNTPVGIKSGTYTVQYRYDGDNNHTDFEGEVLTVSILGRYGSNGDELKYPGKGELIVTIKKAFNDEDCYGNFTGVVEVDGVQVQRGSEFTDAAGSTVLTFSETYMKSLSVGDHMIRVIFKDGEISLPLQVAEAAASSPVTDTVPSTGDNAMPILWAAMILASLAGAAVINEKKRRQA